MNQGESSPSPIILFSIRFNNILYPNPVFPNRFPSGVLYKILYIYIFFTLVSTCCYHSFVLILITEFFDWESGKISD